MAPRRGHVRLLGFFFALALGASLVGAYLLHAIDAPRESGAIVLVCTWSVATLGFLGVFVHRLTIAKARERETEQYLARIRRASDKYRALLEGAADMLLVVEPATGKVLECNLRARDELEAGPSLPPHDPEDSKPRDARRDEPTSVRVDAIVFEGEMERLAEALRSAASTSARTAALSALRLRGKDGRTIVADARLAAVELGDERVVHLALRDVTREKEMEQRLAIHERLSSIGLLTAGVAHEINNPLEAIGNYVALLEKPDLAPADRARYLEQVRHGFQRIGDIVHDLLRFARPKSGEGTAELGGAVERALKLVRYTERFKDVDVELEGFDRPLRVVGDAGRLEQICFNLLLNAAQAVRGRGHVRIVASEASAQDGGAREIVLAIEDDGPGIPAEHLERVFDPFFSTSGGTGLGLSVSYGIARAHGGTLAAENRPGGGARFVLRLPLPTAADPNACETRAS